jgi:hypothetical protein
MLTKIPNGYEPTTLTLPNVIPVAFHVAEGQSFGRLNDTAVTKIKQANRKREIFSTYTPRATIL